MSTTTLIALLVLAVIGLLAGKMVLIRRKKDAAASLAAKLAKSAAASVAERADLIDKLAKFPQYYRDQVAACGEFTTHRKVKSFLQTAVYSFASARNGIATSAPVHHVRGDYDSAVRFVGYAVEKARELHVYKQSEEMLRDSPR